MPLFQQSVVKKYLNDLDKDKMQQRWAAFTAHFHNAAIQQNILKAKEEEYQEGFVRDLFVTVLGYTLNPQPDYNFVLEKKTEADSTKSDGAILQGGKVVGVIELKDTATTDLDKVEKQAFGYKHRHRDCAYVITANFQKLRFYINDAIEYEEFDLFTLTRERFDLLYLCLGEQNIFKNLPLLIKQASLTQEEAVTKKLYSDYSGFRKKLFYNITELNPQHSKIELFQKTQKLLDRFLFILFAEDRMLVPANSVRKILQQWQQLKEMDAAQPLYQRFKLYFGYLNTGRQDKEEIFPYNGGLFAADEILDSIKINDTILYDSCIALSNYDFQTEIDVNILGHIFEHSLNELEELQAEAAGNAIDKAKTKRKKDGIFYTPRYITKYIVANTVGALCEQKKQELAINEEVFAYRKQKDKKREKLVKLLDDYRHWLLQLTICDPACGSGAFLNQALEYLIAEHRHIDELKANLFGDAFVLTDLDNEILEKNLFGVDINEEAVEIARLSLWLRTAKKDRKLSSLTSHIQCGNSLIDDPAVAGDKAFNWQKAFPKIFPVKEKQPFHITFVTHYSRRNERMDKYRVPHKEGFWMNEEAELLITGYIKDVVIENNFKILAYNICGDHVHMMIVAEEAELPEIMRKIKGKTSQRFKEHLQVPKEEEFHLWAQKYNTTWLNTAEHYNNAIAYIENNRSKHELPINKGLQPLVQSMLTTEEAAYAVEYKGGFDVVIGNPPYVKVQNLNHIEIDWLKKNKSVAHKRIDISLMFIELAKNILKTKGLVSFITSNQFLVAEYGRKAREFILNKYRIKKIVDFGDLPIFEDALTYVSIFTFSNESSENFLYKRIDSIELAKQGTYSEFTEVDLSNLSDESWVLGHNANIELLKKLANFTPLELFAKCNYGIISGNDDVFIFDNEKIKENKIEEECLLPLIRANNCYKYGYSDFDSRILYPYEFQNGDTVLISLEKLKTSYPNTYTYLISNKELLEQRKDSRTTFENTDNWYSLTRFGQLEKFSQEKIVFPGEQKEAKFGIDINNSGYSGARVFSITPIDNKISIKYLLSILNSRLFSFYIKSKFPLKQGGYYSMSSTFMDNIPIVEKSSIDQLPFIAKADIMLATNKELQELKQPLLQLLQSNFPAVQVNKKLEQWPSLSFADFLKELSKQKIKPALPQQAEWMGYFEEQKTKALALQTIIDTTDAAIDEMVYALYGLSDEEIKIVEGNEKE